MSTRPMPYRAPKNAVRTPSADNDADYHDIFTARPSTVPTHLRMPTSTNSPSPASSSSSGRTPSLSSGSSSSRSSASDSRLLFATSAYRSYVTTGITPRSHSELNTTMGGTDLRHVASNPRHPRAGSDLVHRAPPSP
ncbi:hypothetical protein C8J57DRAFT_1526089 [Mycena rebaudengoi]|nr:hypothetical protein C8J57DRAFT_1526089 [Mycena rebaudengoi]